MKSIIINLSYEKIVCLCINVVCSCVVQSSKMPMCPSKYRMSFDKLC